MAYNIPTGAFSLFIAGGEIYTFYYDKTQATPSRCLRDY